MPRKRVPPRDTSPEIEDDDDLAIVIGPGGHRQRSELIDPHRALPGGMLSIPPPKRVRDQREPRRKPAEIKASRKLYRDYLEALTLLRSMVLALAHVFEIDPEEAQMRLVELHDKVLEGAPPARGTPELLREYDLTKEARFRILASHMYSGNPAASLKAVDTINNMDAGSHSQGGSYESYVFKILQERRQA